MGGNRRILAGLLVAVAFIAAACSKDEPAGTGGGSPSTGAAPGTTASSPTAQPTEVQGLKGVKTGEAAVEVSGDLRASLDLKELITPAVFQPPPGGLAINWKDDERDLFGIGGTSFTGSQDTTEELVLSLAVNDANGFHNFISSAGECTITIDRADPTGVEGSFDCTNLGNGADTIDATGTFSASP